MLNLNYIFLQSSILRMLLQLLDHSIEIFLNIIEIIILRRDFRTLGTILAACKRLKDIIENLQLWRHKTLMNNSLRHIKNMLLLIKDQCKLIEYNNNIYIYKLVRPTNGRYRLYTFTTACGNNYGLKIYYCDDDYTDCSGHTVVQMLIDNKYQYLKKYNNHECLELITSNKFKHYMYYTSIDFTGAKHI